MTIDPSIDPGQAKAIQEDYMAIIDSILQRIKDLAGKKDPRISIVFGNEPTSYKRDPQKGVTHNQMTPEKAALLKKTLENPQSLDGSLRIYVDGKLAYHVKDQEVKVDTIGLRTLQKVQQKFSAARLVAPLVTIPDSQKVKDIQPVPKPEPPLSFEGLLLQVTELRQIVDKQQQTITALTAAVEKISSFIVPTRTNDPSLSSWLAITNATIKATGESLVGKLNKMRQGLQSQAVGKVQEVKSNVTNKVQDVRTNVLKSVHQSIAEAQGRVIERATKLMLEHGGDKHPDGSITFESKNYLFTQNNGKISITSRDGRGEVMKDGQFTPASSAVDLQRLDNMAQLAQQDFAPNQNQQAYQTQQTHQASVRRL